MQGQYFAHISPNPRGPEGAMLIKVGQVKAAVGVGRWLLSFQGKNYNFSNVFSAEALDGFAFFDTAEDRQKFISDLIASNTPVTEAAPAEAVAQ